MAAFPALNPSSRVFTPGDRAHALLRSMGGRSTQVRHSNVITGQQLAMTFKALTEAQMISIQAHYIDRRGQFATFSLPAAIWSGTTDQTIAGYSWRYIALPAVTEPTCGRYTVSVSLEMLAEYAPPVQTGDAVVRFPRAAVTVEALAFTVQGNAAVAVVIPAAAITVEALAPSFAVVAFPAAAVTVAALAPTFAVVAIPAAAVTVAALAPSFAVVAIPAAAVTVAALAPWVEGNPPVVVAIPAAAVTVAALTFTVSP